MFKKRSLKSKKKINFFWFFQVHLTQQYKLRQKYKKSNNTRNYCEDHTFGDMREFTNWASLREKVLKRDNHICVKCGDNRKDVEVIVKYRHCTNLMERLSKTGGKLEYVWRERKETRNNFIGDHIIPIALGGNEWDLKNIQTLCLKCNRKKTNKDIKKIAIERKIHPSQSKL